MAGANYMGGKRYGPTKARSKDSMGRIQKTFFGRQRLNMLSNGIPTRRGWLSSRPETPAVDASKISVGILSEIGLTHAKGPVKGRDLAGKKGGKDTFVLVPATETKGGESRREERSSTLSLGSKTSDNGVYVLAKGTRMKTPKQKKETTVGSSEGSAKLHVLDVLDTTEPIFRRATLNRILNLPDLAGLSTTSYASKRRIEEGDTRPVKRQKTEQTSDLLRSPSHDEKLEFIPPKPPNGIQLRRPSLMLTPELSYNSQVQKRSRAASSQPPSSDLASSSFAGSVNVMGLQDHSHDNALDADMFDFDLDQPQTPPPQGQSDGSVGNSQDNDDPRNNIACEDGVSFLRRSRRRLHRFAEDNLYEHEDPWHTIGVILGLEDIREDDHLEPMSDWVAYGQELEEVAASVTKAENSYLSLPSGNTMEDEEDINEEAYGHEADEKDAVYMIQARSSNGHISQLEHPSYSFWTTQDGRQQGFDLEDDVKHPQLEMPLFWTTQCDDLNFGEYDTNQAAKDSQNDHISCTNSSPGFDQESTPQLGEEPQSPFRVLLESNRKKSSVHTPSSNHGSPIHHRSISSKFLRSSPHAQKRPTYSMTSGLLLAPFTYDSHPSSPLRTPSPPNECENKTLQAQSPFRLLLASRKTGLNLTGYSTGDSDPTSVSSPESIWMTSKLVQEVDGMIQGLCLFPDDDEGDDD
ncbi:hypothetical protein H0H87_004390 [Tephrocybe sp. NHM501043]|nr:hypothetical protein H0H87_004390 [Tephrocybe sp. NHM501043]